MARFQAKQVEKKNTLQTSIGAAQLDEYWNNVVLGALGNTLEPDMITGLRLVESWTVILGCDQCRFARL